MSHGYLIKKISTCIVSHQALVITDSVATGKYVNTSICTSPNEVGWLLRITTSTQISI